MCSQLKANSYYLYYHKAEGGHCSVVQGRIQRHYEQQTPLPKLLSIKGQWCILRPKFS